MRTTKTNSLVADIEDLVRRYVAAQRAAAAAAVERAFNAALPRDLTPRRRMARVAGSTPARTRSVRKRRPPAEVAELSEQLCDAVCAHPGETMAFISSKLGQSARALNRPMNNLRSAGRIRSAGQRQHTRYFPMTSSKRGSPTP
jgi:hypothetical protein